MPDSHCDAERQAGVLLHITSLPAGNLGQDARLFVDFLAASGFHIWQLLPTSPTHGDQSPYNSLSAFAGNPKLIDYQFLKAGYYSLNPPADEIDLGEFWQQCYRQFKVAASEAEKIALRQFIEANDHWLEDYALYSAIKFQQKGSAWNSWPEALRCRHPQALSKNKQQLSSFIQGIYLQQHIFYQQWQALKDYANAKNILLFGDMPIFVAHDSADCWSKQHLFELDHQGNPAFVTGVPPDYFSDQGQRWGNPHYHWQAMEGENFSWWMNRFEHNFKYFDWLRVDHFRGFEACWKIPPQDDHASNGWWQQTPGGKILSQLQSRKKKLPIVAEDLGIITQEVEALRDQFRLPGMKILQFAFDSDAQNPYLPHNHVTHCVVYTGTHDNDTTLGWFENLSPSQQEKLHAYLGHPTEPQPWPLIRWALASVANTTIIPMQDLLALDSNHRMNRPGTTENNWQWRFQWQQIDEDLRNRLATMNILYGR